MLPRELAERTGSATRYVDEWLRGQAAGGYVEYDPQAGTYSLTPEQAFALTDPDGAVYAPGAFQLALGALRAEPQVTEAFRTGSGVGWHEHDDEVFAGLRALLPARLHGQSRRQLAARPGRRRGQAPGGRPRRRYRLRARRVHRADGAAYPNSTFTGSDYHEESVTWPASGSPTRAWPGRVQLRRRLGADFAGGPYDLVTSFDCLHDMGDPVGAARHIKEMLSAGRHLDGGRARRRQHRQPTTSTRSAGSTTRSLPSCASRTRCRRTAVTRSGPRRARSRSGGSSATPDTRPSAGRPRRRSTSSTKPAPRKPGEGGDGRQLARPARSADGRPRPAGPARSHTRRSRRARDRVAGAWPVVRHLDHDSVVAIGEMHRHRGARRVPECVGQALLHDPVTGGLNSRRAVAGARRQRAPRYANLLPRPARSGRGGHAGAAPVTAPGRCPRPAAGRGPAG